MSATRSLPSVFVPQNTRERSPPVLFSGPRSEPIPIRRNNFAHRPYMFDSDDQDEVEDMPTPRIHAPEPGSPSEVSFLSGVCPRWGHIVREHPERIDIALARFSGVQAQSQGTPEGTPEATPAATPCLCSRCSGSVDGDSDSDSGPTPADDDEEDYADPLMFDCEKHEPSQAGPSAIVDTSLQGLQPMGLPFFEHQGSELDYSGWLSPPITQISTATARGVFTMPYHTEHDGPSSPAAIGSASGAHCGPVTREAGHHHAVALTPSLQARSANANTGLHPGPSPPSCPQIPKHTGLHVSPVPSYMLPQGQPGQPLSPLENAAMNTGAVISFTAYVRSLYLPVADSNYWVLFFDGLIEVLVYVMGQSPHFASFWTLVDFSCLMVAHELGCRRRLLRHTWRRIMRLRGFRWEFTRRSKISIVDLCLARILQLVVDELRVNRTRNIERIQRTGYMVFGHGPAQVNATALRQDWTPSQPQTDMPFSFSIPSQIPQLVFDLMGGQHGLRSYEQVCDVLEVSHLLIHPPPTFPFPAPAPPVQAYHTNIAPVAASGPDRP